MRHCRLPIGECGIGSGEEQEFRIADLRFEMIRNKRFEILRSGVDSRFEF